MIDIGAILSGIGLGSPLANAGIVPPGNAAAIIDDPKKPKKAGPTPDPINHTPTADPNVFIGKNGARITMDQFKANQAGQMPFTDFHQYANWIGGWDSPHPQPAIHPYYRTYPQGKVSGMDVFNLYQQKDPKINAILDRNIAKPGEVPMYGPDDADMIKALIANHKKIQ